MPSARKHVLPLVFFRLVDSWRSLNWRPTGLIGDFNETLCASTSYEHFSPSFVRQPGTGFRIHVLKSESVEGGRERRRTHPPLRRYERKLEKYMICWCSLTVKVISFLKQAPLRLWRGDSCVRSARRVFVVVVNSLTSFIAALRISRKLRRCRVLCILCI